MLTSIDIFCLLLFGVYLRRKILGIVEWKGHSNGVESVWLFLWVSRAHLNRLRRTGARIEIPSMMMMKKKKKMNRKVTLENNMNHIGSWSLFPSRSLSVFATFRGTNKEVTDTTNGCEASLGFFRLLYIKRSFQI